MAMDEAAVDEFAELFRRFLDRMAHPVNEGPSLAERLAEHLGVEPIGLSSIAETFEPWEHANVQAALDAYLAQPGHDAQLVGVLGGAEAGLRRRPLGSAGHPGPERRRHALRRVALGAGGLRQRGGRAGRSLACIQFGIVLVSGAEGKLAMLVRGADDRSGPMGAKVTLEVMAPEPEQATAFLTRFRTLMAEHNVYRGQMVSLGRRQGPYATLVVEFHPRPEVGRDDIVLADGVLARIEGHVVGIGAERVRLRDAGRHLKRGLLLHGPPGTGKTLTVRYLASRMADATVLILSGGALGLVGPTCALARPSPRPSSCSRTSTWWPRSAPCRAWAATRCCSSC